MGIQKMSTEYNILGAWTTASCKNKSSSDARTRCSSCRRSASVKYVNRRTMNMEDNEKQAAEEESKAEQLAKTL
jgi:hypothetical protein